MICASKCGQTLARSQLLTFGPVSAPVQWVGALSGPAQSANQVFRVRSLWASSWSRPARVTGCTLVCDPFPAVTHQGQGGWSVGETMQLTADTCVDTAKRLSGYLPPCLRVGVRVCVPVAVRLTPETYTCLKTRVYLKSKSVLIT